MSQPQPSDDAVYICPMHKDVRQNGSGKYPQCGMAPLMAAAMMLMK